MVMAVMASDGRGSIEPARCTLTCLWYVELELEEDDARDRKKSAPRKFKPLVKEPRGAAGRCCARAAAAGRQAGRAAEKRRRRVSLCRLKAEWEEDQHSHTVLQSWNL